MFGLQDDVRPVAFERAIPGGGTVGVLVGDHQHGRSRVRLEQVAPHQEDRQVVERVVLPLPRMAPDTGQARPDLPAEVLAVGKNNPRYTNVWNYTDIYPHMLKEITHFFSIYKDLEGKRVEVKSWHDAAYARDRVLRAVKMFDESKAKAHATAETDKVKTVGSKVKAAK